jgi:hypothetical protein
MNDAEHDNIFMGGFFAGVVMGVVVVGFIFFFWPVGC